MKPPALHARITADLAGEIASGAWPPGHRIPFEHELMARYGCARATAGKAVHALAVQGLVERRRKAGTFVAAPHLVSAVLEIPDIRAAIEARCQAYRWMRLARRLRRPHPEGEEGPLAPKGPLLEVSGVHYAAGAPFAHEARLIDLAEVPAAAGEEFGQIAPGAWLLAHVAWSRARHEISATNPDLDTAEALRIPRTRACLVLKRWTWRGEAGVTFARQTFPSGLMDLTAAFAPGPA
ncbi:MAG: UTRA domain-containing protein [Caulobacteraceae bacterium]